MISYNEVMFRKVKVLEIDIYTHTGYSIEKNEAYADK